METHPATSIPSPSILVGNGFPPDPPAVEADRGIWFAVDADGNGIRLSGRSTATPWPVPGTKYGDRQGAPVLLQRGPFLTDQLNEGFVRLGELG
jgi:hypothetical protein